VNSKGIYSIENYLTSRRLMYWQVYLHKTVVAFEKMLVNILLRAKYLSQNGVRLFATPALRFFLENDVDQTFFNEHPEALKYYELLDDNDIWCSVKIWMEHEDKILSTLAQSIIHRHIFRVEVNDAPFDDEKINTIASSIANALGIPQEDAHYMMSVNTIQKDMYDVNDDRISILYKDGTIKDIAESSDILNINLLSKKIRKYYLCYHRF